MLSCSALAVFLLLCGISHCFVNSELHFRFLLKFSLCSIFLEEFDCDGRSRDFSNRFLSLICMTLYRRFFITVFHIFGVFRTSSFSVFVFNTVVFASEVLRFFWVAGFAELLFACLPSGNQAK